MNDNSPVFLRQTIDIGTLILIGKSGKEYKFIGINPVRVEKEDAPDLLKLERKYKSCCANGEIKVYPYLEEVQGE